MIAEIIATRERTHSRALQLQMQGPGDFYLEKRAALTSVADLATETANETANAA
jgi:hypothetical protein